MVRAENNPARNAPAVESVNKAPGSGTWWSPERLSRERRIRDDARESVDSTGAARLKNPNAYAPHRTSRAHAVSRTDSGHRRFPPRIERDTYMMPPVSRAAVAQVGNRTMQPNCDNSNNNQG